MIYANNIFYTQKSHWNIIKACSTNKNMSDFGLFPTVGEKYNNILLGCISN
jgi:hypothetical protein